ncbi:hypothetical protein DAEQUDRAFT_720202 [Daedalea quercina L-15889]|uniref:Uncharacterized protein n=1 Tax=Daedalea quercina L-15889 TaxID=1314783 RepID=A0A165UJD5_9APHY|nr:hypothetical protein DAEQUDRAFT_720202 [Daedalea quercina L-15889]
MKAAGPTSRSLPPTQGTGLLTVTIIKLSARLALSLLCSRGSSSCSRSVIAPTLLQYWRTRLSTPLSYLNSYDSYRYTV